MFTGRQPRSLPPRYTRDGVSINQLQLEAGQRERRDRMIMADTNTGGQSTGIEPSSRAESRDNSGNGTTGNNTRTRGGGRDIEGGSGDEGDRSEQEDQGIDALLERVRKIRAGINAPPRTDEITRGQHSGSDLAIMAAIRTFIAEAAGHTRDKGPRNSVVYGPLRAPPLDPENDVPSLFRLTFAWHKPPSHRYNRAASLLAADQLINDERYSDLFDTNDPGLLLGIARQIRVHVRHLSAIWNSQQYQNSLITTEQREEEDLRRNILKQAHAANHRRRLTMDRRGATAAYYSKPAWIAILNHVGATSMSSDDLASDEELQGLDPARRPVYYIIGKSWRSVEFMEFLRLLDRLADVVERRTKFLGRPSRIRRPVPNGAPIRESARTPSAKLNRNFYSSEQQAVLGPYHRYYKRNVDLQAALLDIRTVAQNEGLMT